jgi:hypothetical protein
MGIDICSLSRGDIKMASVSYCAPSGEAIENPSLEFLRELIFKERSDYWEIGSGDASLQYRDGKRESIMALMFSPEHGFHLQHSQQMMPLEYFVPSSGDELKPITTVVVGAEPMKLPVAFFLSRELAWVAVEEFYRTGNRTPKVKWVMLDEQVWDFE